MKKNSLDRQQKLRRTAALLIALSALLLGVLYYGLFRDNSLLARIPDFLEHRLVLTEWMPVGYRMPWLPSFLHAFATLLCLHVYLIGSAKRHRIQWQLLVFSGLIVLELSVGVVDRFDILAIVFAALTAEVLAAFLLRAQEHVPSASTSKYTLRNRLSILGVVSLSGLLSAGSYTGGFYEECAEYSGNICVEYKSPASPVYMSYQRLRESVQVEAARPPDRLGRVYLYENYVFLNEKNEGIHIIDNTDPVEPVNVGFIRIPGNTDLAMRDNYLYADSYVDLITLDMNDPTNIQIINRQEDLFPFDAFQNIPNNVSFERYEIDAQFGVVVSYQLLGN